jgi:hypothetical protein
MKKLLPKVTQKTIIEGGHYLLEERGMGEIIPKLNPVSTLTFREAVGLYVESKRLGKDVSLSFLVGDLSLSPKKRIECKQGFDFPTEYLRILDEYGVAVDSILLFYESTLRNRAVNRIRSGLKKGSILKEDDCCYVSNTTPHNHLLSNIDFGKKPVPNCRMILGQQLKDKESLGFIRAINFCNSDVYKCRGKYAEVYHTLLEGKMDVINVNFTADGSEGIGMDIMTYLSQNCKLVLK